MPAAGAARRRRRRGIAPYGPIVAALRSHLRADPGGLDECGPLRPHLALLLPELGDPAADSDRATLFEAVRCAFARDLRRRPSDRPPRRPAVVRRGDPRAARGARLAAARDAAARRRRLPLRRAAARAPAAPAAPRAAPRRRAARSSARAARPRADGGPARRAAAGGAVARRSRARSTTAPAARRSSSRSSSRRCSASGSLQAGRAGSSSPPNDDVPVPETVRDAVLIGVADLSEPARAAAEAAAVAGDAFDLGVVAELVDDGRAERADRARPPAEEADGRRAPSATRSRARRSTPTCRGCGGAPCTATSPRRSKAARRPGWRSPRTGSARGEDARAREALVRAARESEAVHAYRDAAARRPAGARAVARGRGGGPRGSRRSSATRPRAELVGRARRRRRARGASWPASAAPAAKGSASPTAQRRLAAVSTLQGDRETRVRRAPPGRRGVRRRGPPGRGGRRAAGDGQPPPSREPATARRSSWREARAASRGARPRPTCAPARWGSRASRGPRAAITRAASRPSAPGSRWRSSTT